MAARVGSAAQEAARDEEPGAFRGHTRRRQQLHVLAVHPRQLLHVEDARAVAHVFEREAPREFVERQQLLVLPLPPASLRGDHPMSAR